MITFLFIYTSFRYYTDIKHLNCKINEEIKKNTYLKKQIERRENK
jgi:hypothetical protein